jgi:hypothetical protein
LEVIIGDGDMVEEKGQNIRTIIDEDEECLLHR